MLWSSFWCRQLGRQTLTLYYCCFFIYNRIALIKYCFSFSHYTPVIGQKGPYLQIMMLNSISFMVLCRVWMCDRVPECHGRGGCTGDVVDQESAWGA